MVEKTGAEKKGSPSGISPSFVKERLEHESLSQQRLRALPFHDRLALINSSIARNAVTLSASPYKARAYAPELWRHYASSPNIIAGYSTRHMGTTDAGLPFHAHLTQTMSGALFPSYERFEGARTVLKERTQSTWGHPSRFAASGHPGGLSSPGGDARHLQSYAHDRASAASITPLSPNSTSKSPEAFDKTSA